MIYIVMMYYKLKILWLYWVYIAYYVSFCPKIVLVDLSVCRSRLLPMSYFHMLWPEVGHLLKIFLHVITVLVLRLVKIKLCEVYFKRS